MVQTRIKSGIICVTVTGNIGGDEVREVIQQVKAATQKLRSQNKPILILVDISGILSENSQARLEAMKFLKLEYDKLAVFGAKEDISQVVLYLIRTTAVFKKARYFDTEHDARQWLKHKKTRRFQLHLRSVVAFFVSIFLLAGIISLSAYSASTINQRRTLAKENYANGLKAKVDGRFSIYEDQGLGFVSLFNSTDHVNGNQFDTYFTSSRIADRYPGFTAISFIQYVSANNVDAFNAEVQSDPFFQARGISPTLQQTNKSFYLPVVFIEPKPNTTASYGRDLSASQERTENFISAMLSGKAAFSKPFGLLDATGTTTQRIGFYVTLPVYKGLSNTSEQRSQNIYGFVNTVFVYKDFFETIRKEDVAKNLNIRVLSDQQVVYSSETHKNTGGSNSRKLDTANRDMILEITYPKNFGLNKGEDSGPAFLIVVGMIIWTLSNILYFTNARRRTYAVNLAQKINEDLQVEKAKDDALLGAIGEGLIAFDTAGNVTRINKTTKDVLGYGAKELVGSNFSELVHASRFDGEPILHDDRPITRSQSENHIINDSFYYHTKDGRLVPVRVSVAPVMLRGELLGSIELFQDITDEHQLDKAKDDFIGLVSHQLSTPSTAVKANLGMIIEGYAKTKDEINDAIRDAYDSNERQINIIQDFLNVTRVENKRLVVNYEQVDLQTFLQNTIRDLKTDLAERNHTVDLQIKSPIRFYTDTKLLGFVIDNLISNANKYSKQKDPIVVSANKRGQTVFIRVIDKGVGISKKDQAKLFERFSRITNPLSSEIGGTGLGLYIAQQMIERMGGTINVKSGVGKGSEFLVKLPIGETHG